MRAQIFFVLASVLLLACPPAQQPVPPNAPPVENDGGDYPEPGELVDTFPEDSPQGLASPCGRACEHLRTINCSDGFPVKGISCYRGCLSMAGHQRVPTKCWTIAKNVEGARACGGLRCLTR